MRVPLGALAMYPDETCFDPNRPAMLPYFFDDLTESKCKVNLITSGNTSGNTAQPGQMKTITNPDGSTSVVPAADPATLANAQAACVSSGGSWNQSLSVCAPSFLSQYGLYIGLGIAGIVLFLVVTRK